MKRYMLDTNTVSHLLRKHPAVTQRVIAAPMACLCLSAITEGQLRFGLARWPEAKRLHLAVRELLAPVRAVALDLEHYHPPYPNAMITCASESNRASLH